MFTFHYNVKMFDTDASGFLFFTSQMRMAHEAYEAFMVSSNLGIGHMLKTTDYLLPIVHAETDYHWPSRVGDRITIQMTAERVGDTSFTLAYRFMNEEGTEVGSAKTVHTAVDRKAHQKRPLPGPVRQAVQSL